MTAEDVSAYKSSAVIEAVNELRASIFPSLRRRVSAPSKNGSVPKTARTGWSLTSYVSKCVLKHWLVSDHPVCGASVAARLFIDAAATPPLQGGECAPLNSSTIHSHLH